MTKLFFFLSILLFSQELLSQTYATTTGGRKVVLNKDGTWKYVDNNVNGNKGDNDSECEKYHRGNVTINNNHDYDVYFYYSENSSASPVNFVKVKSKSSKTLRDVCSSDYCGTYVWAAFTEEVQINSFNLGNISSGFVAKGDLIVSKCGNKEIDIEE